MYVCVSVRSKTHNYKLLYMWMDLQKLPLIAHFVFQEIPFWSIKQLWFSCATLWPHQICYISIAVL